MKDPFDDWEPYPIGSIVWGILFLALFILAMVLSDIDSPPKPQPTHCHTTITFRVVHRVCIVENEN